MRPASLPWWFLAAFVLWAAPAEAQVYCLQPGDREGDPFEASVVPAPLCGDNICSSGETCGTCPCDCCTGQAILVLPISGLVTTEAGGTATFRMQLNTKPSNSVTVALSTSDPTEGTVSPASFTFTNGNWNNPQTATVTGVDDALADGNVTYSIVTAAATSSDPDYNGMNADNVQVSNTDNEGGAYGIAVTPTAGLSTTESGGTAAFTLRLTAQPAANVTVALSSSDSTEGSVSPASLTFTSANWSSEQTVTVTGVDDPTVDGAVGYTVVTAGAVSGDANYSGMNPADVSVTNNDNDVPGITVTPAIGLVTTEAGGTATFTVVLNTQPSAGVSLGLSSTDTGEGTVAPAAVSFTTSNWNEAQTVTITGMEDVLDDGDVAYSVVTAAAVSGDVGYEGINPPDVSVTNSDDDVSGFSVSPLSGLLTTESGGTATFMVVLTAQPGAPVTVDLSSSDASEGTVSPANLTFTATDWNLAQQVTLTGVDDSLNDGPVAYTAVIAPAVSADPGYDGQDPADVAAANQDDDQAQFILTPLSGLITSERGRSAVFTVVLSIPPTAPVDLPLSSSAAAEGTVSPTALTFSASNWDVAQTVTVTGLDDALPDGDLPYSVVTAPASSADARYNGRDADDVALLNLDDDRTLAAPVASFEVSPGTGAVPLAAAFDGQRSTADPVTPLVLYRWSYKDGSPPGAGPQSNHTYSLPGGYLPELRVVDELGQEARTDRPVRVADSAGRRPPLARIVATALQGETALTASFSCDCQAGDGAIVSYRWELGTTTAAGPEVLDHAFGPGRHLVRLTVVDENGLSSTASTEVIVTQGGQLPGWCELTLSPASGAPPLDVEHRVLSGAAQGITLTFSDGSTSTLDVVARRYDLPGRYPVRLEVTDSQGLSCTDLEEVVVVGASGGVPPSVLGSPAGAATCAVPYEYQPAAAGTGPFTWAAVAPEGSTVPEGLVVDPATGRVSWLPSSRQTGAWQFRLEVQNIAGAGSQLVEVEVDCGEQQALAVGCGCGTTPGGAALLFGVLALTHALAKRRRSWRSG